MRSISLRTPGDAAEGRGRKRGAMISRALSILLLCAAGEGVVWAQTPEPAAIPVEQVTAKWTGDLDGMIERRMIRILVPYSKTYYLVDKGAQYGLAYEMGKKFEEELNARLKTGPLKVQVVFVPVSRDEILPGLVEGRGDVAVGGLTVTPERDKLVDFTAPGRINVDEVVVTGPGAPALARVEDLAGREVFVRPSSSYHESLVELNRRLEAAGKKTVVLKDAPEALETEDILEMVNAGLVKITVVDSYLATFWKQVFPGIKPYFNLTVRQGAVTAPAIRNDSPKLKAEIDAFLTRHGARTEFGNVVMQRYFKSTKFVKSATNSAEMKRFQATVAVFRKYGDRYSVDWLLMMAQGYQESGLDQSVKSPVGAVGVMQVMPKTGKELKVGDIRQIEPNIHAGVKYIRFMIDQYFVDEPMDKLNKGLFAFAAYNAGPGRVDQLRQEARRRGLDPNLWFNNVERIAAERVGRETVQYVSNIYKYYVAYTLVMDEAEERRKAKQSVR
jgi:membrane-bound lytic murein transglycosylase MltF